ncbi:MAG: alpha/beta fold hydrolase [Hyphomicrobiaceae bacterium]
MANDDGFVRELIRVLIVFAILPAILLGAGAYLYFEAYAPRPYAGVKLQENVVYVSARRFEEKGLQLLRQEADGASFLDWTPVADALPVAESVTILVHGYNAQDHKVATYFSDFIDTLREQSGAKGTFIVFDWPAVGIPMDELPTTQRMQMDVRMGLSNRNSQPAYELTMYGIDQRRAETVGAQSLLALLSSLANHQRRITLVGHSMGCYLLQSAVMQSPGAFREVGAMYWLAADVDVDILQNSNFRTAIDGLGAGLFIHYSAHDAILTGPSRIANLSHRIGAVGSGSYQIDSAKLNFLNLTDALGTVNVHGGYLRRNSESARIIAATLKQP